MNSRLLNKKKYPPKCAYCARGRISPDGNNVLCKKMGIMAPDDSCRSYIYDVLKREPYNQAILPEADPKDFEL